MAGGGDAHEILQRDDPGVGLDPGLVEQRPGVGVGADGLHMGVRVHNETDRGAIVGEHGRSVGQEDEGDRVKQHRGRAGELAVGGKRRAVSEHYVADLRGDEERLAAGLANLPV